AAVYLGGSSFRFFTKGTLANGDTITITFLRETWSYQSSTGEEVFNKTGANEDKDGNLVNTSGNTANPALVAAQYIDIRLIPSLTGDVNDTLLDSIAASGAVIFRLKKGGATIDPITDAADPLHPLSLGNRTLRYFLPAGGLDVGDYTVEFLAGAWHDSAN